MKAMWFKRRKTIFEILADAYGGPFVCRVLESKGRYDDARFTLRYQRSQLEYFVGRHHAGYTVMVGLAASPDRTRVTREHHDGLFEFDEIRGELGDGARPLAASLEGILAQLIALEPLLKSHFLKPIDPPSPLVSEGALAKSSAAS